MTARARRFIDTNMLVRYFTNDLPDQAAVAEAVIDSEDLFVSSVIVLECGYVLTRIYGYPRDAVVDALVAFLQRENVEISDLPKDLVAVNLLKCKGSSRRSFGDALIVAAMQASACEAIFSFDQRLAGGDVTVLAGAPEPESRGETET